MKPKTVIHDDPERNGGCPKSPKTYNRNAKTINLAIQGGGAHGAYAWGVLDRFLEDGRVKIEGISATSAGSMNAVVTAYGNMTGGRGGARAALYNFWKKISEAGAIYSLLKQTPWEYFQSHWKYNGRPLHALFSGSRFPDLINNSPNYLFAAGKCVYRVLPF